MIPLSKPASLASLEGNVGTFEIEALYPGYGATVGNSLRRVLLSSLEGAAITRVKIKDAPHEFATLKGVEEDALSIILNLKRVRLRIHGDEVQTATLKIKGEKKVTASDLDLPSQVELVTPEAPIATLTDKGAELEMEVQIERGVGYIPAESHKRGKEEIGAIALDAFFTPVERVSVHVEQMRVGDRTDFDRLQVEIQTDGTITPQQAFLQAVDLLVRQFSLLTVDMQEQETETGTEDAEPKKTAAKKTVVKKAAPKKAKKA